MTFTFYNLGGGGGAAAETVDGIAGEAIALGQACYLSVGADLARTAGKIYLADADDPHTSSGAAILGLCTSAAASDGDAVTITTSGLVETGLAGLTSGKVYGLSSTAGALALTASPPWIGVAESASSLRLSGVYTTSGLTAGAAMGSDASGVLTAGLAESIGYAVSTTKLQMRARFGATDPADSIWPAPTHYWKLNDAASGAASTAAASAGGAAFTVGGGTWGTASVGAGGSRNVVTLDGGSASGLTATILALNTASWTVMQWIYLSTSISGTEYLWTLEDTGAGGRVNFSGNLPRYYSGSYDNSTVTLLNTTWYHIVTVVDNLTVRFYTSTGTAFDGTPMAPAACASYTLTDTTLDLLRYRTANLAPAVVASECAVWNTALTAAQVEATFGGGTPVALV